LFSLTELPERLIVIGGGPIGSEMSQTFARFGSQVTLIDKSAHILINDDAEAALVVQKSLEHDGVKFVLNANTKRVEQQGHEIVVIVEVNGLEQEIRGDKLLIAIGRQPNVEGLGLEAAGVEYQAREGVKVNEYLQTSNPKIFAAGDICSKYKFTHAADFMARIVIRNSLFMGRGKVTDLTIPWATYTSPELAHVGLKPAEAKAQGMEIVTYTQPFKGVDRAILEDETEGFVKVHVKKGTDQIVGATIVGSNAGDMISELTLAITQKVGLSKIAAVIHPYPTKAEAIRKLGDQFNKTKLTPFVKGLFQKWLKWSRS
jgi:pyruvate/2-oxoglutarate dehydrogenase complex dihydrolipoamide dehydrogenase (E3) component